MFYPSSLRPFYDYADHGLKRCRRESSYPSFVKFYGQDWLLSVDGGSWTSFYGWLRRGIELNALECDGATDIKCPIQHH